MDHENPQSYGFAEEKGSAVVGPSWGDAEQGDEAIALTQNRIRRLALFGGVSGAHLTALGQRAEGTRLYWMTLFAVTAPFIGFLMGLGRISMLPVYGLIILWVFIVWQVYRIPADSPLLGGTIAPEDVKTLKRRFRRHSDIMLMPLPDDPPREP